MAEEYVFSTNAKTVENLDELCREAGLINEQRMLELYDIANSAAGVSLELISGGLGIYEVLSLVKDALIFGEYPTSDRHLTESLDAMRISRAYIGDFDKVVFSVLYLKALSDKGHPFSENGLLPADNVPKTFAYVRNRFSDEAFDVISEGFPGAMVVYKGSFRECAELLDSGEVGYCLFPLEERGGVRLPTVSELIHRYDFKINSVTPVFGFDGDADLKYALVSRHFTVPAPREGDDRYIEFRVSADESAALTAIVSAASAFGMTVYRVNTVTFENEGEAAAYFTLVLRDGGCGFAGILTYASLFAPDAVPVGVYKNLE